MAVWNAGVVIAPEPWAMELASLTKQTDRGPLTVTGTEGATADRPDSSVTVAARVWAPGESGDGVHRGRVRRGGSCGSERQAVEGELDRGDRDVVGDGGRDVDRP